MNLIIRKAVENEIIDMMHYDKYILEERLRGCVINGMVYTIKLDDIIIGVIRYSLFWQSIPFLDMIYIDSHYQGEGIGKQAINYWESQMNTLGYKYVLTSTQEDESAKFFYEKMGYIRIGEFLPPAQEAKELVYQKTL